jgi:serine/threonine protein kinase
MALCLRPDVVHPAARRRLFFGVNIRIPATTSNFAASCVLQIFDVKKTRLGLTEIFLVDSPEFKLCVYKRCRVFFSQKYFLGENPVREGYMYDKVKELVTYEGKKNGSEFILNIFNTSFDGKVVLSQLEYCPGGDLFNAIANNTLPNLNSKRRIFHQACQAVGWLHARDIVHRDISPENIFIATDGTSRLADFGVSCTVAEHDRLRDGHFCGKKMYRSPEQNTSLEYSGKSSDIFALGVSLVGLLTGNELFKCAHKEDPGWQYLMEVGVYDVVNAWNLDACVPSTALDLLSLMLCLEPERITIEAVLLHPFFSGMVTEDCAC